MKNNDKENKVYKIAVIGGGVIGGMVARQLTKYEKNVLILEKEGDVAMGQSKANSGIVHGGYDPKPNSLKAILNVKGSKMMENLCKDLKVKYRKNGTMVVGFTEEDVTQLKVLKERGDLNGVEGLEIISGEEARLKEPNLDETVSCALYVPSGAIVCPYELTIHSIGNAMDNGAELKLNFQVDKIENKGKYFLITSSKGDVIEAEYIVNAAGIHSDEIAHLIGDRSFNITGRRGEYFLLDKETGDLVDMTIFRVPTNMGKGVLATKTVDGNILLGPTSEDIEDKENKETSAQGLGLVRERESEFFKNIPWDKVITQFTGVRAHGDQGDFIINSPMERFVNAAGIESPGLSSAPAIAEMVVEMLMDMGVNSEARADFDPIKKGGTNFKDLSMEEKNALIQEDDTYGRVICRCEEVTEGEIRRALRENPPARDVDGIKRRTRSGMGRCQGGFCMPNVAEIIADELGISYDEVTKMGGNSKYTFGRIKG